MISHVTIKFPAYDTPEIFETDFWRNSGTFRVLESGQLEEQIADFEIVGGTSPHAFARVLPESIKWTPLTNFDAVVILRHCPDDGHKSLGTCRAAFRNGKLIHFETMNTTP